MSKYKTGDKVVLEIIQDDNYGDYKVGNKTHSWWNSHELLDNGSVPLSKYIKSMAEKLHNQRDEINRLLKENKELKINANWCDNCAKADSIDEARSAGQQEAWELVQKIESLSKEEFQEAFGTNWYNNGGKITRFLSYAEAAAKVAEWEKAKEEIKVGDVLEDIYDSNVKCTVTNLYPSNMAYLVFDDGTAGMHKLDTFKKTGRHMDIDSFLKQIRGKEK